ncbi:RNA polymerase Rpb3/RpoA insert domain-containing protein [Amylocarpus encephaloides]|uniref:DNA-directed RNA polymerases I and III subunit RPAC1 n=1 Tax=Amylocarpus encephaloides TaxID=45428 RepID=A0A9P7YLS0_9HELO|nr:RNA polymerase Rpb3/RpoA insert domain-containing protein [Amylocarpus encephaloides]
MAPIQASQAELDRRKIVGINAEIVTDVTSTDFPGHWPGEDHSWDIEKFKKNFQVKMYKNDKIEANFSLVGIDAAVANALRRILISEIPSVAIERVFIYNNSSVIQDEVLAARLGLIPLKGSKAGIIDFLKWWTKPAEGEPEGSTSNDLNTIRLKLNVGCTRNKDAAPGETDPFKAYHNAHIYAKDIEFVPFGHQVEIFGSEHAVVPTNPNILIAKLRPGQCIDIEMDAIKGVGRDHAKYSPVAPASYRLLPTITITQPILGTDAEKFARCFPQGVIGFEPVTKKEAKQKGSGYVGHEGEKKAVVLDAMKDTVSRECLRHEEFQGKVKLGRVRDHFIFSVESVGQWDSDVLFVEAVKSLKSKCEALRQNLRNMPE